MPSYFEYLVDALPYTLVIAFVCATVVRDPRVRSLLWLSVLMRPLLPLRTEAPLLQPASDSSVLAHIAGGASSTGAAPFESSSLSLADPVMLWSAVALLILSLSFVPRFRLWRKVATSEEVDDQAVLSLADRSCASLGINTPRVVACDVPVPFTMGTLRPHIVLPNSLVDRNDASELEAAVLHEAVHIKRRDDFRLQCELLLRSLLFFDPGVWVATLQLRRIREQLCDRAVIAVGRLTIKEYGMALLRLSQGSSPGHVAGLVRSHTEIRSRIISMVTPSRAGAFQVVLAVLVLFLLPGSLTVAEAPSIQVAERPDLDLLHPVPGASVSSGYGDRLHPTTYEVVHHNGIDFLARRGTPVRAAAAGRVVLASAEHLPEPSYGRVVAIEHVEGVVTFYAHLHTFSVSVGDSVEAGEKFAKVGSTGVSTGPHLHFEVRVDNFSVPPEEFLVLEESLGN